MEGSHDLLCECERSVPWSTAVLPLVTSDPCICICVCVFMMFVATTTRSTLRESMPLYCLTIHLSSSYIYIVCGALTAVGYSLWHIAPRDAFPHMHFICIVCTHGGVDRPESRSRVECMYDIHTVCMHAWVWISYHMYLLRLSPLHGRCAGT